MTSAWLKSASEELCPCLSIAEGAATKEMLGALAVLSGSGVYGITWVYLVQVALKTCAAAWV